MEATPISKKEHIKLNIINFIKNNVVFLVALTLAIITSFIIKPNKEYFSYIDYSTICSLFSTLAIVNALKNHKFFTFIAEKIVSLTGNMRVCSIALTYTTFIGSMLIANDMALLTFLPLSCFVLTSTENDKHMIKLFILQNVAANLGGMLTPFGNPQNLYLYSYFNIPTDTFMYTMLYPFIVSIAIITVCCIIFFPKEQLVIKTQDRVALPKFKTTLYLVVFTLVILSIFRIIPYWVALIIVVVTMLIFERTALLKVDYPLLLTFVCFFIFSGNLVRIDALKNVFESLLEKNVLLVSTLSCQCISNVPSAILLSKFTTDYKSLLLGVNIGGVGTLISSLASLITFRTFMYYQKDKMKKYLFNFTIINFSFLIILFIVCTLLLTFNII